MRKSTTIYHLQIGAEHSYFGSISAIYEVFSADQLNVAKTTLWGYGISSTRPYINECVTIRKGLVVRKKGNRGLTNK